ncbi:hypothetical protein ACVWWY_001414 [Thermostichus sp. OS-CIW-38]
MLMLSSVLVLLCGCSGGGGLASLPGVVQPTIVASASPTPGSPGDNPSGSPAEDSGGSGSTPPPPGSAPSAEEEPNPDPTTGFVPGEDPSPDMIPVDELDRLFPNLPPDPGEEGKQTLEGIDADGDGVRDDVQRWIYRRYPNDELKRKAMLRYAKALQASIVNVDRDSRDQVRARVLDRFRAIRCARLAFGGANEFDLIDEVAEARREVEFQMLNTQERVIADLTVDAKFSGQVVGAEEWTCTDPIR